MSKSEEARKGQLRDWIEDSDSQKKDEHRLELCDKSSTLALRSNWNIEDL